MSAIVKEARPDRSLELTQILQTAVEQGASDIILKDGKPPVYRLRGELVACVGASALTTDALDEMAAGILRTDAHRMRFAAERHADLAFEQPGSARFRVHLFRQRGGVGIIFRVIPLQIRGVSELNLPPAIERFAEERRGLILVTGATGNGKSTTLAALVDSINQTAPRHIVTIEDPIEYVHHEQRSIISQREVGEDVNDFPSALQAALREDPDVVMVGEMRDLETIETAITAAETGHLVMSTLHTADATETILRVIGAFPEHRREQVRCILANVLRGVVSQRLLRSVDGTRLWPAVEVMVGTLRVRDYIEQQRVRELPELIAQGQTYGMQSFDQSLLNLVRAGRITQADAMTHCRNPRDIELLLAGFNSAATTLTTEESRGSAV